MKLQAVGHRHCRDVALLEGALAGAAEVGESSDRRAKVVVPSFEGVRLKGESLGFPLQLGCSLFW